MEIAENIQSWRQNFHEKFLKPFYKDGVLDYKSYHYIKNTSAPSVKGISLPDCRLLFISSSGAYLPDQQEPFNAKNPLGDYSFRRVPFTTDLHRLEFAHDHYGQTNVREDPQTLLPLDHLQQKVTLGQLTGLTDHWISFMGYQPDVGRIIDELIPEINSIAKVEKATGVLLVPA